MTDKFIKVDVENLYVSMHRLQEDNPELFEDQKLMEDMLAGSTDFEEVMDRLLSVFLTAQERVVGGKERKKALDARIDAGERVMDWAKSQMLSLMQQAQQKSMALPEATVSVNAAKKRVEIEDIESIPQGFYTIEKVAKKKEIGDELKSGSDVPGAKLVDGVESLTVRTR